MDSKSLVMHLRVNSHQIVRIVSMKLPYNNTNQMKIVTLVSETFIILSKRLCTAKPQHDHIHDMEK